MLDRSEEKKYQAKGLWWGVLGMFEKPMLI